MQSTVELWQGLGLLIAEAPAASARYATSSLQRGLLLLDHGEPLCEEAVGFGVPVLKRGLQTIFPGGGNIDLEESGTLRVVRVTFQLNRVERLLRSADGIVGGPVFYGLKDLLAATIRRLPASRQLLTRLSSLLRRTFGWKTTYAESDFHAEVTVTATVEPSNGTLHFDVDCQRLPSDVTEFVLMHEQGARFFDRYGDSSGLRLQGDQIGCWDEVRAGRGWFESSTRQLAMQAPRVSGATLFRGRELIGSRLAWAGFGYSIRPPAAHFHHGLSLSRVT